MPRWPEPTFADDGTELRYCGSCDQWKPKTEEFFYFRKARNQWDNPCRECRRIYSQQFYENNPPTQERQRNARIKYLYGITNEDYEQMLIDQDGVCAVCATPPTEGKRLSVDHDHDTGHVRGLLCYKCNTAAGLLGDDPALAAQLTLYLKGEQ
jgi:hypothetical protein